MRTVINEKRQQFLIKHLHKWKFSRQQGLGSGSGLVLDPDSVCHVRLDFDPELANIGSDNAGMSDMFPQQKIEVYNIHETNVHVCTYL